MHPQPNNPSWVNLLVKELRAQVVAEHLRATNRSRVVCFTCGNASAALRKHPELQVIGVGANQELQPGRWFSYSEVARAFDAFDATSGHLPWPLMVETARLIRQRLGTWNWPTEIPCGSGETVVVLALAYPEVRFRPIRLGTPGTEHHPEAPLNGLLALLFGPTSA